MQQTFRKTFKKIPKDVLQWFPGHMGKGMRQMQQQLKLIDCIIEVHDARIPFSGRNEDFKFTLSGMKPHILLMNKKDLIDQRLFGHIAQQLREEQKLEHVFFTNCKDQQCEGIRRVLPLASRLITESDRYNRQHDKDFTLMVIGVPNVGKSSVINVLRNRHLKKTGASAVGATAGITRSVLTRIKIQQEPKVFLIDTPGILTPSVKDSETGMKLALCGCTQDHLVGDELIADYLLFWLNKVENFDYVPLMGLEAPTDSIEEVLIAGSRKLESYQKVRLPDGTVKHRLNTTVAAQFMVKHFRTGVLGRIFLDEEILWIRRKGRKIDI